MVAIGAGSEKAKFMADTASMREEFDKLTKEAQDAKKAREDALKAPKTPESPDGGGGGAGMDISRAVARNIRSGTFSATIAGSLSRAAQVNKTEEELLVEAHIQSEELKAIRKNLERGGAKVGA